MNDYSDIIHREYKGSQTHTRMSMHDRAAQFSPFAALTGYEEIIDETARFTDEPLELTREKRDEINDTVRVIRENIRRKPRVRVEYFIPDGKKKGGKYITAIKKIVKTDDIGGALITEDGTRISVGDISELTLDEGDGSLKFLSNRFDENADFLLDFSGATE